MAHTQSFPRIQGRVSLLALSLLLAGSGLAAAQGNTATQLRQFIDGQVGGSWKLLVPAHDVDLPQPRLPNGSPDPRFQITEAKRYLGKQLFHDPIRTARILPEFGGVPGTRQTASCGSCHIGEAASKAGTLLTSRWAAKAAATPTRRATSFHAGGPGRSCCRCDRPTTPWRPAVLHPRNRRRRRGGLLRLPQRSDAQQAGQ